MDEASPNPKKRVIVLGATGTIGRATVRALVARGHDVDCLVRPGAQLYGAAPDVDDGLLRDVTIHHGNATERQALEDVLGSAAFDAVVSCMASRTGAPRDAWAVDHDAHILALEAATEAGVSQFVQLSAICVQRPMLAFQQAKLAFEERLIASPLAHTIVRPTAYFKSLSGQVERVKAGKPFLVFGDGRLTACKPISDGNLGDFIAGCLADPKARNSILPIGGPGPAITPLEQGEYLFSRIGKKPRFRHVPVAMLDAISGGLGLAGRLVPSLAEKAEFARIGRYYATQSMLVFDDATNQYSAEKTPSTGSETLFDYYDRLIAGQARADLGDHAVF